MAASVQSSPRRPPPPPPPVQRTTPANNINGTGKSNSNSNSNGNESLTAAADLIRTLDSAFEEMSSLSASAAKDAEDARRNARAASEVARRYTARSFPQQSNLISKSVSPKTTAATTTTTVVTTPSTATATTSPTTIAGGESRQSTNRKRKIPKPPPSSAERLAQSHAEDVLTLSLELERTKQELERERHQHDQTRMAHAQNRAKNDQLEAHMERVMNNMEQQREEHGRSVDRMKQDLQGAQDRMDAAEDDAQAAVDLATDSNESRQQLEGWLHKALEEVTLLRHQMEQVGVPPGSVMPTAATGTPNSKHKNSVRFAESPTVTTIPNRDGTMIIVPPPPPLPSPSTPSRSMVLVGRSILQAARSPESKMHSITLTPEKSAERRQRLRERLKYLDEDDIVIRTPTPNKSSPARSATTFTSAGVDMGQKAMDACHSVANVVRESARQLQLPGRWGKSSVQDDVSNVDNVTRRYCHSVEVNIKRQASQIKELSSLCGYLEDKLVVTSKENGVSAAVAE